MNKLFDVVVGQSCSCHYMEFCHHGPHINTVVRADSIEQIKNIMGLCDIRYSMRTRPRYAWRCRWIEEQESIDLDQLAALSDDLKERFE
jgi:hypothetical protein